MNKKNIKKLKKAVKENKRLITMGLIALLILLFFKKTFFIAFFILLNYFVLWLKMGVGIDSPIEVISFGTFICGYVYGPVQGLIVAGSSLLAIIVTGRINIAKLQTNIILFIIGYSAHFFRFAPISYMGIAFLAFRYLTDVFLNIIVMHNPDYFRKIPSKLINFIFYIIVYFSFAPFLARIM